MKGMNEHSVVRQQKRPEAIDGDRRGRGSKPVDVFVRCLKGQTSLPCTIIVLMCGGSRSRLRQLLLCTGGDQVCKRLVIHHLITYWWFALVHGLNFIVIQRFTPLIL